MLPRTFIKFDIENEKAVNVKLLKRLGIVDWIRRDANNVNYGMAKTAIKLGIDTEESLYVFFHHSQVKCSHEKLRENDAVAFGYRYDDHRNRYEAINLIFLKDEEETDIIELCISSENKRLWIPVFNRYLSSINDIDQQIELCLTKILSYNNSGFRPSFADSLSKEILIRSK